MTLKDLFRITIKVIGLFSLFQLLPFVSFSFQYWNPDEGIQISRVLGYAGSLLFYVVLIMAPDLLINIFKLEKGFDSEKVELQGVNPSSVFHIALLVIGGFLFIKNFPLFISHTYYATKSEAGNQALNDSSFAYNGLQNHIDWAVSFINTIIGYLIVRNYDIVGKFLKVQNEKTE